MKQSRRGSKDFKVTYFARRYDKQTGKYVYDVRYETVTEVTPRTLDVSEAFGLGIDETKEYVIYDNFEMQLSPHDIVYITGESGSGKSVLLRELEKDLGSEKVTNITEVTTDPDRPLVEQVGKDTNESLMLLSLVGLGDAWLFIKRYRELSDGQKYRFRLAKAIESGKQYWLADEFCATLDRDTAKIVAFNVQKHARRLAKAVIAATTHTDLFEDLKPSVHVHKGLGREVEVNYYPNDINPECSILREMKIGEGTLKDYAALAEYHYRATHTRLPVKRVFTLKRGRQLAGAIVYQPPAPATQGRSRVLGRRLTLNEANKLLTKISRVVVHPKFRSIGAGAKIVRETLPVCGKPYVETVAVMAQYNPFFEKAGMRRILTTQPNIGVANAVKKLESLGFNTPYLSSERMNLQKLKGLSSQQIERVRAAIHCVEGPARKRIATGRRSWYKHDEYTRKIDEASLPHLARMLSTLAVLSQPKIYLFWFDPGNNPLGIRQE